MLRVDPRPSIEEVLNALARPWVEPRDQPGGQHYSRLIAREAGNPRESSRGIVKEMLDPIATEFLTAMEQALPNRLRSEIHWAYYFSSTHCR
jgi:Tetracyclin repressor-like, C-terminal domain